MLNKEYFENRPGLAEAVGVVLPEREDDEVRCPRCSGELVATSPSGNGEVACDHCSLYWEQEVAS